MADITKLLQWFKDERESQNEKDEQRKKDEYRKEEQRKKDELVQEEKRKKEENEREERWKKEEEAREVRWLKLIESLTSITTPTSSTLPITTLSPISVVPPFEAFNPDEELWNDYKKRFETHMQVHSATPERLTQLFLTNQTRAMFKKIETWHTQQQTSTRLNEVPFDTIASYLETQYDPQQFILHQRFLFWKNMSRLPNETARELADRTRAAARKCDFPSIKDPLEEALRTRYICSLENEKVISALVRMPEKEVTFEKAIEITAQIEQTIIASREIVRGGEGERAVQKIQTGKPTGNNEYKCLCCGKKGHKFADCRHKDAVCHFCNIKGHLEAICFRKKRSRESREARPFTPTNFRERDSGVKQNRRRKSKAVRKILGQDPLTIKTWLNGVPFEFEIDTGSPDSFCTEPTWTSLGKPQLTPTPTLFRSVTGNEIPVIGYFDILAQTADRKHSPQVRFYVTTLPNMNLLGRSAIVQLKLQIEIKKIDSQSEKDIVRLQEDCHQLCNKYKEIFANELGCLKDIQIEIHFKENISPKFVKHRTVPFALLEGLEKKYEEGIKKGLWTPVAFNDYGTPVVPVPKESSSGKPQMRVCGDYSVTVNPQLATHRHPLPRPEELMQQLGGSFCFSKVDLADAYNQIPLGPESRKRLALSTHKGVLLQNRLPFGISSAPGYFQEVMCRLTEDLPGVSVYLDDILVSGKTPQEHLDNLEKLFQRLKERGLRCNRKKCAFAETTVEYLGHTLTRTGVKKSSKAHQILEMPAPANISELRAFLGAIQFYAKFIPHLASMAVPLYELTQEKTRWKWTRTEEQAFKRLKEALNSDKVLVHHDPKLPIGLSCDASMKGLGAVLFHTYPNGEERPIAYASKILTTTQQRYSQIQKEALSIIFGVTKFHQFIYGREFTLITDHKPLVAIFDPHRNTPSLTANRLARWAMILNQYRYKVQYRRTKDHGNADALSRLPYTFDTEFDKEQDVSPGFQERTVKMINQKLNSLDASTITKESGRDIVISSVIRFLIQGWPRNLDNPDINQYRRMQQSLHAEGPCLFLSGRIVVPSNLRKEICTMLHEGHPGTNRMKRLARTIVYWPKMNIDIERTVQSCDECMSHQNQQPKSPVQPWPKPEKAWSRVHIDHAVEFLGTNWLVMVDATSNYPCIHPVKNMTTRSTIEIMEQEFAHFGFPITLVTDNAAIFHSSEFTNWCRNRGIRQITGAPYHPETNGAAERMIQTFKQALRKSQGPRIQSLQEFLMNFRRTPLDCGLSPSELLNGRQIRGKLDALIPNHKSRKPITTSPDVRKRTENKWSRLQTGNCFFRQGVGKKARWQPGTIQEQQGYRTYLVKNSEGNTFRKHFDQIRPRPQATTTSHLQSPRAEEPRTEVSDSTFASYRYTPRSDRSSEKPDGFSPSQRSGMDGENQSTPHTGRQVSETDTSPCHPTVWSQATTAEVQTPLWSSARRHPSSPGRVHFAGTPHRQHRNEVQTPSSKSARPCSAGPGLEQFNNSQLPRRASRLQEKQNRDRGATTGTPPGPPLRRSSRIREQRRIQY